MGGGGSSHASVVMIVKWWRMTHFDEGLAGVIGQHSVADVSVQQYEIKLSFPIITHYFCAFFDLHVTPKTSELLHYRGLRRCT